MDQNELYCVIYLHRSCALIPTGTLVSRSVIRNVNKVKMFLLTNSVLLAALFKTVKQRLFSNFIYALLSCLKQLLVCTG